MERRIQPALEMRLAAGGNLRWCGLVLRIQWLVDLEICGFAVRW